jgi:hypothetical protein
MVAQTLCLGLFVTFINSLLNKGRFLNYVLHRAQTCRMAINERQDAEIFRLNMVSKLLAEMTWEAHRKIVQWG